MFFRNYLVSDTGVWWPDLSIDTSYAKDLVCTPSKADDQPTFSIRVRIRKFIFSLELEDMLPSNITIL